MLTHRRLQLIHSDWFIWIW